MNMTKHLLSLIAAAAIATTAGAVTVTLDKVQQRYPWNNLVDIDYTLDGDVDKATVFKVTATIDGEEFKASSFDKPFPTVKGSHRVTWNTEADGYKKFSKNATFGLTLTIFGATDYDTVYIDVLTGKITKEKLGTIGETTDRAKGTISYDEYVLKICNDYNRSTNLVFRVMPATAFVMVATNIQGVTYSDQRPPIMAHSVTLSPHMVGVFPVTQWQWKTIMNGNNPSYFQAFTEGYSSDYRPVEQVSWNNIRGNGEMGAAYDWPNKGHAVDPDSFVGRLRKRVVENAENELTALDIDLPTEAQLYNARYCGRDSAGGYPGAYGIPTSLTVNYLESQNGIATYARVPEVFSKESGKADATKTLTPDKGGTAIVGSYRGNDYGLFDTTGNVFQWCLDWINKTEDYACVDPTGMTTSSVKTPSRVRLGGSWKYSTYHCTAYRCEDEPSGNNYEIGFRLASPLVD